LPTFRAVTRPACSARWISRWTEGWGTGPGGDLGQAEFEIRIPEQEREDLALLLGAQDG
jgi:hypothetical protein